MKTIELKEIASENGLKLIDTTSQKNGYPANLEQGIIGFESFDHAEEIAQKYNLGIAQFRKKDGWALWARWNNYQSKPLVNSSEDYGDNHSHFEKMGEEDFINSEVKPLLENIDMFDQIESIIETKKEIYYEIEKMEDNEIVITFEGRYFETIKKESMFWYHDTNHYAIGVQKIL